MTFDWHVDIGTILSALAMLAAIVGGLYTLVRRLCDRLDRLDERQEATARQMASHGSEVGRRLDELATAVHRLEDWLMGRR